MKIFIVMALFVCPTQQNRLLRHDHPPYNHPPFLRKLLHSHQRRQSKHYFALYSPCYDQLQKKRPSDYSRFVLYSGKNGERVRIEKRVGSDEVYIGTFLIDEVTGENYFAAWDGQRCGDDAVVVLEVPRVPLGFHGNWISSEQMARHLKHTGVNE